MTEEQIAKYRLASENGSLPDDDNPLFLFSKVSTNLLVKVLQREFNVMTLVRMQLRERGVNDKGQWIGFEKAKQKIRSNGTNKKPASNNNTPAKETHQEK